MHGSGRWRIALAACVAGAAAVAAAPGLAARQSAVVAGVAQASANIAKAQRMPKFKAPGAAVDMAKLKGKRVWIVTSTLAVPFVANIAKGAQQAGQVVGWQTKINDGKGNITEWSRILQLAVSQKVDGIITVGASPEVMKPAMAKAKAAHIPVVDALTADKTAPLVPGTFSHVTISFYDSGRLQADYVISRSKGKASVLLLGDNEFPGEVSRIKGMKDEFRKLCPDCKVTFRDTQVGKLATDLGPTVQTLLRRDPSIDWVLPTYDAQALYVVPAIKQAGLASKVRVVSSDAVPSNLDWTAKADVQVADVGEPSFWSGWAAVDELGRGMLGMKRVDPGIPLRMFDKSNLKGVDTKNENQLWGGSFKSQYRKLWGIG